MSATAQLRTGDWIGTWGVNYTGAQTPLREPPPQTSRTCIGPDRYSCIPITRLSPYLVHNASVTWRPGTLALSLGVNNVFNTEPPRIAPQTNISGSSNTLLDGNYNLYGRSLVFQVRKTF